MGVCRYGVVGVRLVGYETGKLRLGCREIGVGTRKLL